MNSTYFMFKEYLNMKYISFQILTDTFHIYLQKLNSNPDIIVTKAYWINSTVISDKDTYNQKISEIFNDLNNYNKISTDPSDIVINKILSLPKDWNKLQYVNLDQSKIKNSNLPRAYGLIQTHKQNLPLKVIVSHINSPVSEISDFHKNILTTACPRPSHVI